MYEYGKYIKYFLDSKLFYTSDKFIFEDWYT